MKYTYTFSVEQKNIQPSTDVLCQNKTIDFFIESYDDAFSIIDELRNDDIFDYATCAAFVFGLKSLGFAMVKNKDSALVEKLMPHFISLMKEMKKEITQSKATM